MAKNVEKFLDGAAKDIGPVVQEIREAHGLSLYEVKEALVDSMSNHNIKIKKKGGDINEGNVSEENINGYLYGRPWPQMSKETVIEIIAEAFESILNKKGRGNEVKRVRQAISKKINKIYSKYEKELIGDVTTRTMAGHLFRSHYKDAIPFVSKNIEAFSSLTAEDIDFWDSVSRCLDTAAQKKELFKKWSDETVLIQTDILFETVTSPVFCQWVTIRDKDYSDSARKERKERTGKLPKELEKRIDKLTEAQSNSLLAVAKRLEASEDKKHPLCPPEEIDLLLLFKYFSTETRRAALLEEVKSTKKSAGDG